MAVRKKKASVTELPANGLVVIKPPTQEDINLALAQAQAVISELQQEAEALVITNQQDYTKADLVLHRINDGDKLVETKFRPVIDLLRCPLDAIYEIRRGVTVPLATLKDLVKRKMGDHALVEKKRLDAEAEENRRRARELQDQWLRDNPPVQPSFPPQPPNLGVVPTNDPRVGMGSNPVITYLQPPTQPAPQAYHSSTRFERRVRTVDLDLLVDAATAGCLPGLTSDQCLELLTIKPSILQGHFVSNPDHVAQWPGVEVYDHPIITGR